MVFRTVNRFYVFLIGKRLYTVQNMGATLSSTVYIYNASNVFFFPFSFFSFSFHILGGKNLVEFKTAIYFSILKSNMDLFFQDFHGTTEEQGEREKANIRTEMKCKTFPNPTSEQVSLLLFVKYPPKYLSCF